MQLLKITNIPIEYRIQIERARLEAQSPAEIEQKVTHEPAKLTMKSRDIQIRLDTTEMRASIGLESVDRKIANAADRGKQAALAATAQYAEDGNQMTKKGVGIKDIIAQKIFSQSETTTVFLPTTGPVITWQPNDLKLSYDKGQLNFDWKMMQSRMNYVPGKFKMDILQYPKVNIEYLGEPSYVPPSSNPNYVEE